MQTPQVRQVFNSSGVQVLRLPPQIQEAHAAARLQLPALAQQARQIVSHAPPQQPPCHRAMTSHTPPLQRTRGVILLFHSTHHDAKPLPFLSFLKALQERSDSQYPL